MLVAPLVTENVGAVAGPFIVQEAALPVRMSDFPWKSTPRPVTSALLLKMPEAPETQIAGQVLVPRIAAAVRVTDPSELTIEPGVRLPLVVMLMFPDVE